MLPAVFDMFVQERQALDRARGGLGLGLTIVKSLVEAHGGTVSARSDGPGKGSEFSIRLPAARVRASMPRIEVADETSERSGIRVLVVDDNEDAAMLLADALARKGFDTRTAADATEAMDPDRPLAAGFDHLLVEPAYVATIHRLLDAARSRTSGIPAPGCRPKS